MIKQYWSIIPKASLILAIFLSIFNLVLFLSVGPVHAAEKGILTKPLSDKCIEEGECTKCDFAGLVAEIANGSMIVVGPLGTFAIVVSGVMYIISAGKVGSETRPGSLQSAKAALSAAIIGTIIAVTAWVIVFSILAAFEYVDAKDILKTGKFKITC